MSELERRTEALEGQMQHVISVLDRLATRQVELDNALAILADSHIKTQEQFREVAARFRETDARFRQTDDRIDRLVSGIGEFIRGMSERKN